MEIIINNSNVYQYINNNNELVINSTFYPNNSSPLHLVIAEINIPNIELKIEDIDNSKLEIAIENSNFKFINISKINIAEIIISRSVFTIDNIAKIDNIFFNSSTIDSIIIKNFIFRNRCSFTEMKINTFDIIKSSFEDYFALDKVTAQDILIIDSTFAKEFELKESQINTLDIKGSNYNDFSIKDCAKENFLFQKNSVSGSYQFKNLPLKEKKSEEKKQIDSIDINDNDNLFSIKDMTIGVLSLSVQRTAFMGNVYIDNTGIQKLTLQNNSIQKHFYLSYQCLVDGKFEIFNNIFKDIVIIKCESMKIDRFELSSNIFEKKPSIFRMSLLDSNIKTNFQYSNFTNVIWEDINFICLSFSNFDIKNSTFKSCEWQEEKGLFYTRKLVRDETALDLTDLANLKKLKKIYADFKTNFQEKGDFINAGQFYISEQTIKRRIARLGGWREFPDRAVLFLHNLLSVYGESLSKNLLVLFSSVLIFAFIYLFTGFQVEVQAKKVIDYDWHYFYSPDFDIIYNYWHAFILALKNIFPFPTNTKLYIQVNETYAVTQIFEIIQKVVSLIIWASLGQTIAKYLKK